ncbi:MAG: hypothetical protein WDN76_04720 [Alphaproteobacteria bacterium]
MHLLMRGRREDGRDLVIPREYVSHTFRQRAEEIVTRELGPRLDLSLGHELDGAGDRAVRLERLTHLDETLIQRSRDTSSESLTCPTTIHEPCWCAGCSGWRSWAWRRARAPIAGSWTPSWKTSSSV